MARNWTDRRVVITGLGVVSSLGQSPETFWKNVLDGQCGIHTITAFDASAFDCQIAAEVKDFDPTPAFPSPKDVRRADRFAQFAVSAAHQALLDSGVDLDKVDRDHVGAFLGSGIGGLRTTTEQPPSSRAKAPAGFPRS